MTESFLYPADMHNWKTGYVRLNNGSVVETANGKRAQLLDRKEFIWTMIGPDDRATSAMCLPTWDRSCFPMTVLWSAGNDLDSYLLPHFTFSEEGMPLLTHVQYEAKQDGVANALLDGAL